MNKNIKRLFLLVLFACGIDGADVFGRLGVSLDIGPMICIHTGNYLEVTVTLDCGASGNTIGYPYGEGITYLGWEDAGTHTLATTVKLYDSKNVEVDSGTSQSVPYTLTGVKGISGGGTINRCCVTKFKGDTVPDPDQAEYDWDIIYEDNPKEFPVKVTASVNANNEYEVQAEPESGCGYIWVKAQYGPPPCWVKTIQRVEGKRPPGSGAGEGCPTCPGAGGGGGGDPGQIGPIFHTSGVNFSLGLGRGYHDKSMGVINVSIPTPKEARGNADDAELMLFNIPLIHTDESKRNDDILRSPTNGIDRQILTPDYLVQIVNDPPSAKSSGYSINYYKRAYYAGASPECFLLAPNAEAYDSYHVLFSNQVDGVSYQIVRTINRRVITNEYVWTEAAGMELKLGNNARIESVLTQTNGNMTNITRSIRNGATGQLAYKKTDYNKTFDWGEETIKQIVDPDGVALTTTRAYYEDVDETGKWRRLQMEVEPDGSWTRYDYNTNGYQSVVVRSWKDQPTNAAANLARATYYSYEPVDVSKDDGSISAASARTITETIEGQVVSKSYHSYYLNSDNNRIEISEQCATPTNEFNDPSNTRSVSIYYPFGTNDSFSSDKIKQSTSADGRVTSYAYQLGTFVAEANPANSTFSTGGGNDTRTIVTHATVNSPQGIAGKTTREITIANSSGQTLYQKTDVYNSSWIDNKISWTAMYYDDVGHLTNTVHSDGSVVKAEWACCGKDSETDAQGIEHTYAYDDLNRTIYSSKLGAGGSNVATYTTYDAVGRILTTRITGGASSLMTSNAYDLAGRITSTVDAAGLRTSYVYENDGRKVTVTQPGGATQITEKYRDGQTKSVLGTAAIAQTNDYGVNADGSRWTSVHSGSAGAGSPVWTTNTTDMLGRTIKQERSGYDGSTITTISTYNNLGQLIKSSTSGQAATLYEYNELGEQIRSAVDVNGNNEIDIDGTDRITETVSNYEKIGSDWWQVSGSIVYPENGSSKTITNSLQRTRLTGLGTSEAYGVLSSETKSLDILGKETDSKRYVDRDKKLVTSLVNVPDSAVDALTVTSNGLMVSSRSKTDKETTFLYDGLERQIGVVDPRVGTSWTIYNGKGQVVQTVDTRDSSTWYAYDIDTGRQIATSNALGNTTFMDYDLQGHVTKTWGSATYPVSYDFDEFGRMTVMTTYRGGSGWGQPSWPGSPGTGDSTSWSYDPASGLLTSKVYSDSNGTSYAYTPDGKLLSRTWSRTSGGTPLVTTYAYDFAGNMTNVIYSDGTPQVSYSYTRLGQQAAISDGVGTRQFKYGDNLQATSEVFTATGVGVSHSLARTYDEFGRPSGIALDSGYYARYSYDSFGRFAKVLASPTPSVTNDLTYRYLANADFWEYQYITNKTRNIGMTVHKQYNANGNLIDKIEASINGSYKMGYNYTNDALGRRSSMDMDSDNSSFADLAVPLVDETDGYRYNARNEVTGLTRGHTTPSSTSAGMTSRWDYAFDNIGNRVVTTNDGRVSEYTANRLNQYDHRTVPGEFTMYGVAETGATVTVNNGPVSRLHEMVNGSLGEMQKFWHKDVSVTNTSKAVFQPVNVVGVYNPPGTNQDVVTASSGNVFVAETPEGFVYDADGNLTQDGRWDYSWDGENRLIAVETAANVQTVVPRMKLNFTYDYQSRRVGKVVSIWSNSAWVAVRTNLFIYDGWNLLAEIQNSRSSSVPSTNLYVWGLDLSGSLQGAGGIGGLVSAVLDGPSSNSTVFYAYDANGNVSDVINVDSGAIAAHYEYSPFGETVVQAGDAQVLALNPYAFSTKYLDHETTLYYYGLRFYTPETGRWLSRDPINKKHASRNLYRFVSNRPSGRIDPYGAEDRNTCSVASAQLEGTMVRVRNSAGDRAEYLASISLTIIVVGPGNDGSGEDGEITPPGGISLGDAWLSMDSHVANGVSCRKRNLCKGTCENTCCSWDKEWLAGYMYGSVESDLRDPTAPDGSGLMWENATCIIRAAQVAAGLNQCNNSKPSCN